MRPLDPRHQSRLGSGTAYEPYIWMGFGTFVVLLLMYLSLPTRAVFGIDFIWPFAGVVAAIGWGMSPISVTAIVLLVIFGLLQDLHSNAPIGGWAVIHLAAYSLVSFLRSQGDGLPIANSKVLRLLVGLASTYLLLNWIGISGSRNELVDGRLLSSIIMTGVFYLLFQNVFRLGSQT